MADETAMVVPSAVQGAFFTRAYIRWAIVPFSRVGVRLMGVLVATDFSPESVEAVRVAGELARALRTSLRLLHVLDAVADSREEHEAHQQLERAANALEGLRVDIDVQRGPLVETLTETVQVAAADLVVVGGGAVRGNGSFAGHADDIAQALPIPVLVVRPDSERLYQTLKAGQPLRVFVAVDRPHASDAAMAWLEKLRARVACDVIVGHYFWPPIEYERLGLDAHGQPFIPTSELIDTLEGETRDRFSRLTGSGSVTVYCEPRIGFTAINLLSTARACNAHLAVVGTHRRRAVTRFMHGSVSRDVLDHCDMPVLCVGESASNGRRSRPIRNVLMATDFSSASNGCVPHAFDLLSEGRGEVTLLHVASTKLSEHERTAICDRLRGLVPDYVDASIVDIRVIVEESGAVAAQIIQAAERCGVDVIVVGSHGTSRADRTGSVAIEVVNTSMRPVIVVPAR